MRFGTIRELVQGIEARHSDSDALQVMEDTLYNTVSYGDLWESIRSLGNGLIEMGIGKGDNIGIMAENRKEWSMVYLAVTSIGAVIAPISILWEPPELETVARNGDLKMIFTSGKYLDKIAAAAPGAHTLKQVVCLDVHPLVVDKEHPSATGTCEYIDFSGIIDGGAELLRKGMDYYSAVTVVPEDMAEILFVSGTMGVMLSHKAVMANVEGIYETLFPGVGPGKKLVLIIPFSHLYPTVFGILLPLAHGWTVVTSAAARMDRILRMVKDTEPNYIVLVPLLLERMVMRLLGRMRKGKKTLEMLGLGNLDFVFVAGVKCPEALFGVAEDLGVRVLEGYGVSEMAPFISLNTRANYCLGSVGAPLSNVEVKIDGADVDGNGEVLARGPNMMSGYYKWSRSSMEMADMGGTFIDDDGWLHTGDMGRLDEDGFLHITGRLRNIIVSKGGTNIYPVEIEKRLLESPNIAEVRVTGKMDEVNGEYPYALICPSGELLSRLSVEEIKSVMEEELSALVGKIASYKIPKHFELCKRVILIPFESLQNEQAFEIPSPKKQVPRAVQGGLGCHPIMKKISDFLPGKGINENFYNLFKGKAEELTVKVMRASSGEEAVGFVFEEIKRLNVQTVAAPPLSLLNDKALENVICSVGVDFCRELEIERIERAEMGISEFELGVAELGSLFQDASGLHTRLVSMLPPVHLGLLRTSSLVATFAEALEVIEKAYHGQLPPYLSFVTGPSKTADIERELTIGVHGPETLIVLFID